MNIQLNESLIFYKKIYIKKKSLYQEYPCASCEMHKLCDLVHDKKIIFIGYCRSIKYPVSFYKK